MQNNTFKVRLDLFKIKIKTTKKPNDTDIFTDHLYKPDKVVGKLRRWNHRARNDRSRRHANEAHVTATSGWGSPRSRRFRSSEGSTYAA